MDKRFIYKLDFTSNPDCEHSRLYVFPGKKIYEYYEANHYQDSMKKILENYHPSELVCEPALQELCHPYGIETEDFNNFRSFDLIRHFYELHEDRPMDDLSTDILAFHYCEAVKSFLDAKPWENALKFKSKISGNIEREEYILCDNKDDGGIIFSENEQSLKELAKDRKNLPLHNCSITEFRSTPTNGVDAMKRAMGLNCVPIPFGYRDREIFWPEDIELAIIICTLSAISLLTKNENFAYSELVLDYLEILVNVEKIH